MSTPRRVALLGLALVLSAASVARAAIPAYTPNVVDPKHYLSDEERGQVNGVIEAMRRDADIAAAVYLTDRLGDDSMEELANKAFESWKLGEKGKDNGLLLVLVMEDRKMRLEIGYGLEGDLPDVVCRHALDDYLRPRLREHRTVDGVTDALYFLARKRNPSFSVEGRVPPAAPSTTTTSRFDARAGAIAWGGWIALLVFLFYRKQWPAFDGRLGLFAFLCLNPGVFLFIGAALAWQHRAAAGGAVVGFALARLILVPFYVLVGLAVGWPLRRFLWTRFELQRALCEAHPNLAKLEEELRRLSGAARPFAPNVRGPSIALGIVVAAFTLFFGLVLGLDYREPPYFLVPGALFAASWTLAQRRLRRYTSADTLRVWFEEQVRLQRARMERLVRRGHATRSSDGSYSYTAAYYESQSSSSSSSSDSGWSSSSDGGSSGGGGASSDW